MDIVALAIVSAIVIQKSRVLIGLICILLSLNNSSQIAKGISFKFCNTLVTRNDLSSYRNLPHLHYLFSFGVHLPLYSKQLLAML